MTKRGSLTWQILKGVALPFVLITVLIGAIAYMSADDEISEVYDSQMISSAQELWKLARAEQDPQRFQVENGNMGLSPEDEAALNEYSSWRSFRVWRNGLIVMASGNAPNANTPAEASGFRVIRRNGAKWRIFTYRSPSDHILVEVAERLQARQEISQRIVWGVSLPLLFVMPIIMLGVWLGIRWGLRDLRSFAAVIRRRSPNDLGRVDGDKLPSELAPLSDSINALLTKLAVSRDQERLFTDNAAHELRTPLAALGVQAEVARAALTERDRQRAFDALMGGVQRTSRLLDQLLTLARISHTPAKLTPINLYDSTREALGELYAKAHARGLDLILTGDEDVFITANKPLLNLLLSNLLDNAIKHSAPGSAVEVSIGRAGETTEFVLRDHGPGIPEVEQDKVFGRFYRIQGNTRAGSGLGLAIVRTICELIGAEIHLANPADGAGLIVYLHFLA
ncbi:ATP-binding protein [Asticcacaulis sp. EMRT-3]|uniref:ATP-binding protein n=1 Tax=Asticcacaulis sp. EMRT-3 TaxID=3040349 RepID=UPI0024AEA314|nr:ATP-binding protein [Asticcacaulis sp. EMRT-3]MDI7776524.1 ATP-binding protein [Asticcacaulis sp. EMRT-3]